MFHQFLILSLWLQASRTVEGVMTSLPRIPYIIGPVFLPEDTLTGCSLRLPITSTYSPPLYKIWDTRVVPYTISSDLDDGIVTKVHQAIQEVTEATSCISFQVKTVFDYDYLDIVPGSSCETYVGKQGGRQVLQLHRDCANNYYEIVHEFLHTLGFHHEHQRRDRDSYINVFINNVLPSKSENNFYTEPLFSTKIRDLDYDYESLTHYGSFAFSKNTLPTIETKDSSKSGLIGQRQYMSQLDVVKVKKYYNCEQTPILAECSSLPANPGHGVWTTIRNSPGRVGHIIQYKCDPGYTLVGPTNRSCLLDGSWLAYSPLCLESLVHYCNFDDNDWCGWTRSYEGDASGYWFLNQRGTPDTQTGPNNDHTTMASNGFFAYVEASSASKNDVAILTSPPISSSSQNLCFRFSYSMFGQSIGQLSVKWLQNGVETLVFSKSGGQGPSWFTETLTLPTGSLQIVLKLGMLGTNKGDIAIDDLIVADCSEITPDE